MASHLAHVRGPTGRGRRPPGPRRGPGRTGAAAHHPDHAQFVLGYMAWARRLDRGADCWARPWQVTGGELQRLRRPAVGLADEEARAGVDSRHRASGSAKRGYQASADRHRRQLPLTAPPYCYRRTGQPGPCDGRRRAGLVGPGGVRCLPSAPPGDAACDRHARDAPCCPGRCGPRAYRNAGRPGECGRFPAPGLGKHLGPARTRGGRRPGAPPRRGGRFESPTEVPRHPAESGAAFSPRPPIG